MQRFLLPLSAALLLFGTGSLSADTLFSNLNQPSTGNSRFDTAADLFATEFATDNTDRVLTGISLPIRNDDTDVHSIHVSLWSHDEIDEHPATPLFTFTPIDASVGAGSMELATFSHSGFQLSGNTLYWLVVGIDEDTVVNPVFWPRTDRGSEVGSLFSTLESPPLLIAFAPNYEWDSLGNNEGMFALDGVAVPEPSTIAMLGVAGAVGLPGTGRKRWTRF